MVGTGNWSWSSLSPAAFNERIGQAAAKYQSYGHIPRVALYDIAFPADADEYRLLDGYAVMLVAALSQSARELPPKRVFIRSLDSTLELNLISSVASSNPPGSLTAKVFGAHRWEGLYLCPVYARFADAELLLDFASNRDGFIIARFQANDTQAIPLFPNVRPQQQRPPNAALEKLVAREFPGFIERGLPAKKP